MEITAAGLSGICTRFPFNFDEESTPPLKTNATAKV